MDDWVQSRGKAKELYYEICLGVQSKKTLTCGRCANNKWRQVTHEICNLASFYPDVLFEYIIYNTANSLAQFINGRDCFRPAGWGWIRWCGCHL